MGRKTSKGRLKRIVGLESAIKGNLYPCAFILQVWGPTVSSWDIHFCGLESCNVERRSSERRNSAFPKGAEESENLSNRGAEVGESAPR